ncbi:MAG: WYL domain-containing protein [Bacteroidota bacterium]|nr:WYL domain-containing protein [Bacteroidota bacterium]
MSNIISPKTQSKKNSGQSNTIKKLCNAIKQKRLIKFYYESTTNKRNDWRIVEPYVVGIKENGKGNIFLAGWFRPTDAQLKNKQIPDMRHYLIDSINKLEILPQKFKELKVESHIVKKTPSIEVICCVSFK